MNRSAATLLTGALLLVGAPGCLEVRTTEHRVRINDDGSGEHSLRLIDIRSDGTTDSAAGADYRDLVKTMKQGLAKEFAAKGRTIIDTKLYARGDTLCGELAYSVRDATHFEGIRMTKDEIYVDVGPGREIVRTNGTVHPAERSLTRITWARDARRLLYVVREQAWGAGQMLGPWYRGDKR